MANVALIIWLIGIASCLCFLFGFPKFAFKRIAEYHFPNYSREFTKKDLEFIDRHIQLVEDYQTTFSKLKRPFILSSPNHLLHILAMLAFVFILFILSVYLSDWLIDLLITKSKKSPFLVVPYPMVAVVIAMFLGSVLIVPILQFWIIKKNREKIAHFLLVPNYETKVGTQALSIEQDEIRTSIASDLSTLIREGVIDSSKNYSLDELIEILVQQKSKLGIRLGFATSLLVFLIYIMEALNFVKVANSEIVYSPAYSFKVTTKKFEDIISAKYICIFDDNDRRLKLSVTLDNGYKFSIRKIEIKNMDVVLKAADISLGQIDKANDWCQKSSKNDSIVPIK